MMGSFFSAPKPPPVVQAPVPTSNNTAEDEARQARLDSIARMRRGRSGTIATSAAGFLEENSTQPSASSAKRLLGE